jgi:hypothetical protein
MARNRNKIGRRYALVLAEYLARFHDVPPSILREAGATDLMLAALRRDEVIRLNEQPPPSAE